MQQGSKRIEEEEKRVRESEGDERDMTLSCGIGAGLQRFGVDQRHIAIQHQHGGRVVHIGQRLRDRVAGALLFCLLHPVG